MSKKSRAATRACGKCASCAVTVSQAVPTLGTSLENVDSDVHSVLLKTILGHHYYITLCAVHSLHLMPSTYLFIVHDIHAVVRVLYGYI